VLLSCRVGFVVASVALEIREKNVSAFRPCKRSDFLFLFLPCSQTAKINTHPFLFGKVVATGKERKGKRLYFFPTPAVYFRISENKN